MRVTLLGAQGFVGSAFRRLLEARPGVQLLPVTLENYLDLRGQGGDVLVDASGNSKKFLADENPVEEFDLTVAHRLRTLQEFPARCQLHISSVDVYDDLSSPATTAEDRPVDRTRQSRYGLHKLMAEDLVRAYSEDWLIVRLAGMVGPGLWKNPVYDVLHGLPLRIHPDSRYQFLHTDQVARLCWDLLEAGVRRTEVNVCGQGLISPRTVAAILGRPLDLSAMPALAQPRVVDVSIEKLSRYASVPRTADVIADFLRSAA
jgi:nucleoside-diphosphate-sugar epimerase